MAGWCQKLFLPCARGSCCCDSSQSIAILISYSSREMYCLRSRIRSGSTNRERERESLSFFVPHVVAQVSTGVATPGWVFHASGSGGRCRGDYGGGTPMTPELSARWRKRPHRPRPSHTLHTAYPNPSATGNSKSVRQFVSAHPF